MGVSTAERSRNGSTRVWDFLTKLASIVTVALCTAVVSHEVRIAIIESSRFTKDAANEMEKDIHMWVQNRSPILVLIEDMKEIKVRLREIERKIDQ
jgi:Mrp family chromosome partitioning ATPase